MTDSPKTELAALCDELAPELNRDIHFWLPCAKVKLLVNAARRAEEAERELAAARDERDGARLLLEDARAKNARLSSKADADAWRKLNHEERREGIPPDALAEAAEAAVTAWLDNEHATNPAWWPTWEEMNEIERTYRGDPLVDVIRRIVGLKHAPLSQVLDTLRFKFYVCGPWRSRALAKLKEAREALGCATEDDVPEAARGLARAAAVIREHGEAPKRCTELSLSEDTYAEEHELPGIKAAQALAEVMKNG